MSLDVALVHAPVLNRKGETIASTVDAYDFFDACRLSLTYPMAGLWIVNPIEGQRAVIERLLHHGKTLAGRSEERGRFDKTRHVAELDDVLAAVGKREGSDPFVVATTARSREGAISVTAVRQRLAEGPVVLVIGKAWGLAEPVFEASNATLEPIETGTGFNHLSVRSAMAILVDRLLG